MDDRELLKLAAKAAGFEILCVFDAGTGFGCHIKSDTHMGKVFWSPLADDGDALRLAFVVGLKVDAAKREVWYCKTPALGKWLSIGWDGDIGGLRRAIVMAAAELMAN